MPRPFMLETFVDFVDDASATPVTITPALIDSLMVELKNRFSIPLLDQAASGNGSTAVSDVREALLGLGYTDTEVRDTLRELSSDADPAVLLRDALKLLGARRV